MRRGEDKGEERSEKVRDNGREREEEREVGKGREKEREKKGKGKGKEKEKRRRNNIPSTQMAVSRRQGC